MNKPVIASPQVTNHILHRFKLRADKKLGQNFLINAAVPKRIAAYAAEVRARAFPAPEHSFGESNPA